MTNPEIKSVIENISDEDISQSDVLAIDKIATYINQEHDKDQSKNLYQDFINNNLPYYNDIKVKIETALQKYNNSGNCNDENKIKITNFINKLNDKFNEVKHNHIRSKEDRELYDEVQELLK